MSLFGRKKDVVVNPNMSPAHSVKLVKDDSGRPAVDLTKVRNDGHVDLAKRADKAGVSLSRRDLSGFRGQVRVYVDHSQSMEWQSNEDYSNGNVQKLVERALGFALQIDVDGSIPTLAFDSQLWPAVEVTVNNYQGVVNRDIWRPNKMGGTSFSCVFEDVLREARMTKVPLMVIIVTDGSPGDRARATELVKQTASYPVFVKFLAIRSVDYLEELDNLPDSVRLLDNVDAKSFDGRDCPPLDVITDLQFADAMVDELDGWVALATAAGVLT
ncbi:MAG TPA: VWA domain-containing protein [Candidatus Saccharimonadales bacterium]|jgi:hypothetical protein|nr:VWA domain-containing protein [Candidatus Saccharimonadales bacterium]